MRSYREFVVKLRYLHRNPVKRGLVSNLQDWKWSNYRHYGFREIAIVVIESEWTARDREQKERWRSASNFPSPWLGPKIGANLGHLARLIGDKAYDSDRLDRELAERYGIEMIAPHRGERRRPTQDGRPLRRYRRRWRVERLFAWLHHFRRLVIRWEYHVENFFGMVRLGCMQILFRYS